MNYRDDRVTDEDYFGALADLLAGTDDAKRRAYWLLHNDRIPPNRPDLAAQAIDALVARLARSDV